MFHHVPTTTLHNTQHTYFYSRNIYTHRPLRNNTPATPYAAVLPVFVAAADARPFGLGIGLRQLSRRGELRSGRVVAPLNRPPSPVLLSARLTPGRNTGQRRTKKAPHSTVRIQTIPLTDPECPASSLSLLARSRPLGRAGEAPAASLLR